jgi:uncharacterized protein (DUF885 family)
VARGRLRINDFEVAVLRRDFLLSGTAAAFVPLLNAAPALAQPKGDAALIETLDRLFWAEMPLSPENATGRGQDKGSYAYLRHRLDEIGPDSIEEQGTFARGALSELDALDASGLGERGRRWLALARDVYRRKLEAPRFGMATTRDPYMIGHQSGVYFDAPDFLDTRHPVDTSEDAEAYLDRLEHMARLLDEQSAFQRAVAGQGRVAPAWSLDMVLEQMAKLRAPAAESSPLVQSLVRRASEKGLAGDWAKRATAIVLGSIYPALDRQMELVRSLRATTRPGDGIWRVDNGAELYAAQLRLETTTDMSPQEIHRVGLAQVADLTAQLDRVLRKAGRTRGSVGQRLSALNLEAAQLHPNTAEGRAALIATLNQDNAAMRARLPALFANIPDEPLEIRAVPVEIQEGASLGYYYSAPLDGSRPAIYWINLRNVADWPKYTLKALTYHEGVPGHHLQRGYVNQADAVPLALSQAFYPAYSEGWAHYAEQLAAEQGAYQGLEEAGYLQSLLFRAARMVIDTGLHHYRWDRAKAVDYYVKTVGFTADRSLSEVNRYCTMPGQATCYKIGHIVWDKARQKAKTALGARFDPKWFHGVLEEGPMPLSMLEARIEERTKQRLAAG